MDRGCRPPVKTLLMSRKNLAVRMASGHMDPRARKRGLLTVNQSGWVLAIVAINWLAEILVKSGGCGNLYYVLNKAIFSGWLFGPAGH